MLAAVIYEVNIKKDGVKVSPNGEITVSAPVPSSLDERKCTVLCFDANGIRPCAYEETESYRITKLFLDDRKWILHHLLGGIE